MRTPSLARTHLLVTVSDAARHLRRHEQTIRAMIRRGDLPTVRFGRLVRIFASAVEVARRRPPAPAARRPVRPAGRSTGRAAGRSVRRELVPSTSF